VRRLPTCPTSVFSTTLATRRNGFCGRRSFHRHRQAIQLDQAQRLPQVCIDGAPDVRIVLQELACIFASLTDPVALITEPGTAFLDQALRHSEIEQVAFLGNTFTVDD